MSSLFGFVLLFSFVGLIGIFVTPQRKTKKRLISISLVLLFTIVLVGCSETSSNEDKQITKEEQIVKEKKKAKKKAQEELAAKEKEEAEKKAQEELAAKEKEEAEKKAQEELAAKEKEEAEKKAQEELAAREAAEAERIAEEEQAAAINQQAEQTVHIAPESGTKYHFDSTCRGLKKANSIVSLSLSEAINQGYDLCGFED